MIDKVELRVPSFVRFQDPVQDYIRELPLVGYSTRVRRSAHYQGVADLRPLGIDAILHAFCKHSSRKDHKLELLDTGKKTYSELAAQVLTTFHDVNPLSLELMRLDLCADIYGVPVSWFQPRTRLKYKRFASEMGVPKYEKMGSGKIETIIAGRRPNVFRLYDKVAESKMQFSKLCRKASPDADPLKFEEEFGFKESDIVTRIERQFGGGRVPDELSTFGKLRDAGKFNPFTPLEIIGTGARVPNVEEVGMDEWLKGTRLRALADEMGFQQLRSWINRLSNGNAARYFDKYAAYFSDKIENCVTQEMIFKTYVTSISEQLAG